MHRPHRARAPVTRIALSPTLPIAVALTLLLPLLLLIRPAAAAPPMADKQPCVTWPGDDARRWAAAGACTRGRTSEHCCRLYDALLKRRLALEPDCARLPAAPADYAALFRTYCVDGGQRGTDRDTGAPAPSLDGSKPTSSGSTPFNGPRTPAVPDAPFTNVSTHSGGGCVGSHCNTGCTGPHCGDGGRGGGCQAILCRQCDSGSCTVCTGQQCGGGVSTHGCSNGQCANPVCSGNGCGGVGGCSGNHCGSCVGNSCGSSCAGGNCGTCTCLSCDGRSCSGCTCGGVVGGGGGGGNTGNTGQNTGNTGQNTGNNAGSGGGGGNQVNQGRPAERDDGSVCLHGDNVVALADGATKRVRALVAGDRVAVGRGVHSRVFMFTHADAAHAASFVALHAAGNLSMVVTPSHYIYVSRPGPRAGDGEKMRLVPAGGVEVGDSLLRADGVPVPVVRKRMFRDVGVFNPQTEHGDIVVGGLVASTFTTFAERQTAHALLLPLRALYAATGLHLSALF